jgi:divinyl protochlorophyllide a 8-vinyl-reductase
MHAARIGPNAITRLADAMRADVGEAGTIGLFARAGLAAYLDHPPQEMVDEEEVARLHRTLRSILDPARAARVSHDAGVRTANYLLARRIPKPVQALLHLLPAALASRLLLKAITRNAWTFAGSGRFRALAGRPVRLEIAGNPLCRGERSTIPVCDYYSAVFERLYRVLVHPRARVVETACEAKGDDACRFEVHW